MAHLTTPQKKPSSAYPRTACPRTADPRTIDSLSVSRYQLQPIDYKAKTFQLLDEVFQLKARSLADQATISSLQASLRQANNQLVSIYEPFGCSSKQQFLGIVHQMRYLPHELAMKGICDRERDSKKLIQDLQAKLVKEEANPIQEEGKAAKHFLEEGQVKYNELRIANQELKNRNYQLEVINEELRRDLERSIQKFQMLESMISEKIRQNSAEATDCQTEADQRRMDCEGMKIVGRQDLGVEEFSFGGNSEPDEPQSHPQQDYYQASIDGLLEENSRLKKVLRALYDQKQGKSIQHEMKQEIDIMERIMNLRGEEQY